MFREMAIIGGLLALQVLVGGFFANLYASSGEAAAASALSSATPACQINLYVSPEGRDTWSGRLAKRNKEQTDGPFATLTAARDAIQKIIADGKLPVGGATVWIGKGIYELSETFKLGADDSGRPNAPVVYRSLGDGEVRILGGKCVKNLEPVTDTAVLDRLDSAAKDKVLVADLKAAGITDYGQLSEHAGSGTTVDPAPWGMEVYFRRRPMTLARWPNEGWVLVADVPKGIKDQFIYDGNRPERWKRLDDVWLHGFWMWDWSDSYVKVASVDPNGRTIATLTKNCGYLPERRWYALNILEELDTPGEYYIDRQEGRLYFWPPVSEQEGKLYPWPQAGKGETVVSTVSGPLVALDGASCITLRGLTFECGQGNGVNIKGGEHNRVLGCVIRNIGTVGVRLSGGSDNGVQSCDVYDCASGGIRIAGGDRKTLTPGRLFAENNDIHDYQRVKPVCRPGITIEGVGNRAANNYLHDAPHIAIVLAGNENAIEFNRIERVCRDTSDAGAIYQGHECTELGNRIRWNMVSDLVGFKSKFSYPNVIGIYLDDTASGTEVFGNIIVRTPVAILIGGGRDVTIANNIVAGCKQAVEIDARGLTGQAKWFKSGWMMAKLRDVNYDKPPWSTRYPRLVHLPNDQPGAPLRTCFERNIIAADVKRPIVLPLGIPQELVPAMIRVADNLINSTNDFVTVPGAAHARYGNYQLRKDSPAWKLGFKPIPVEKIGLYDDEYRAALPAQD